MDKLQIMVVEDELLVALEIESCLESLGYSVIAKVTSGEAALKQACDKLPDLVMMDITLKGKMDGIQTAKKLHARLNLPIIFLTGNSDLRTLKRAKNTNPVGIILKPFNHYDLQEAIEKGLTNHKERKKRGFRFFRFSS